MAYRYLALLHPAAGAQAPSIDEATHRLHPLRMQCHRPTTGCTLYASADTPVIVLPGQGLVLGHVFSQSGTPLTHARQFPPCPTPGDLRRHILDNCWGAYLIVQADPTRADRLTFQRDPERPLPYRRLDRWRDWLGFGGCDGHRGGRPVGIGHCR